MSPLKGQKAVILGSKDTVLRIYEDNGDFTDYDLLHSDLSIIIDDDEHQVITTKNGIKFIDHSKETLGND